MHVCCNEDALTNLVNIIVAEICGVNCVFTFVDASSVSAVVERTDYLGVSVEINSKLSW